MKEKTTITFLAAECGEFHGMGECIECTSLKEAFRHYQRFCKRSPQMLPSLEFSLHHAEDPLYNEGEYPLVTGEKGKELLSYVPYYANHPLVQEAVRELEQLESQQKKSKKKCGIKVRRSVILPPGFQRNWCVLRCWKQKRSPASWQISSEEKRERNPR